MITTLQVPDLLEHELPEFHLNRTIVSPYRMVEYFEQYTEQQIERGDWAHVKTCLQLAEQLMQSGTRAVRLAIENVYIFSLSLFLDTHRLEGTAVRSLLPTGLRQARLYQINTQFS